MYAYISLDFISAQVEIKGSRSLTSTFNANVGYC